MSPVSADQIELTPAQSAELLRLARAGHHHATSGVADIDHPAGCARPTQHGDRRPPVDLLRHRRQVAAPMVGRAGPVLSGRCKAVWPATEVNPGAGRAGEGVDIPTSSRERLLLPRWSAPELARQIITDVICSNVSASTVRRWLSQEALKSWQYQSWIFIADPHFESKARRVLDGRADRWPPTSS